MPEKQDYPLLNARKVEILQRRLTDLEGIEIDFCYFNRGATALNIGLTHPNKGPLDNGGIDDFLYEVGLEFDLNKAQILDKWYCRNGKHYTFRRRGALWVAEGDNGYSEDETRILVQWLGKLTREQKEELEYA